MIKTLPQIITPFLALGVTLLIAYSIYLYSSQANIDEKIQLEGSEIAIELKKAPTYKMPLTLSGFFLLKEYQDKYPNKPYLEILQMIAGDLNGAALFKQKDSIDRLASLEKGNLKGPTIGRVFFWLIESSVDYLAPDEVYWPGRRHFKSLHNPPVTLQSELFPFGPLRVEQWSNDFQTIKNYIEFLNVNRDIFLNDLKQFIEQLDEKDNWTKSFKNHLTEIDYEAWLREMDNTLSSIETHNYRIKSLLTLKKNYSIEERLPHIKWIGFLGALCFVFGIFIPLIFLYFRPEDLVPPIVNLVITVAAFAFLISGIILLVQDVLPSHKKESQVKYLLPLKKQLLKYKTQRPQMVGFDYTIVNQTLSDNSIKLSRELVRTLEQYQKTVIDSNSCSDQITGILSEAIQQSDVLKSYMADPLSGGQTISIISPLSPDMRKSFFEKLRNLPDNLILQANYEKVTRDIFKIKPPKDKEQLDKLMSEINKIYDEFSAYPETQTCISKRRELEGIRDKLLQQIDYELDLKY